MCARPVICSACYGEEPAVSPEDGRRPGRGRFKLGFESEVGVYQVREGRCGNWRGRLSGAWKPTVSGAQLVLGDWEAGKDGAL